MTNAAIIVGAGDGIRMGKKDKPFIIIRDKSILYFTIMPFEKCGSIDEIILVVKEEGIGLAQKIVDENKFKKVYNLIIGGKERQESVYNAIRTLTDMDYVLVHDAVRPCITAEFIEKVLEASKKYGAVIPAIPIDETIKEGVDFVEKTINRKSLWVAQTPQGFRFDILKKAYFSAAEKGYYGTDDASLVERIGHKVRIIWGNRKNIKITYPADLVIAESFIEK